MEHKVWCTLNKEEYADEGIEIAEQIYDFLDEIVGRLGIIDAQQLFNCWNDYSFETECILSEMIHNNKNQLECKSMTCFSEKEAGAKSGDFDRILQIMSIIGIHNLQEDEISYLKEMWHEFYQNSEKYVGSIVPKMVNQAITERRENSKLNILNSLSSSDRDELLELERALLTVSDPMYFLVIANEETQEKIVRYLRWDEIAVYDYKQRKEQYRYCNLELFIDHCPYAKIILLANMQYALPDRDRRYGFNFNRDHLLNLGKVFVCFVTPEIDEKLNIDAMDFYSYVVLRYLFES